MVFADFACGSYRGSMLVREQDKSTKWSYRTNNSKPTPSHALEEEIYILRRKMEKLAARKKCLTDPKVVEISMILDQKLNEYMNATL